MLLKSLTSVALFLTQVAGVDERVREVLRLDVVADVASTNMAEGGAYVAQVTMVASLHKLVKVTGAGQGGHMV